MKIVDILTTKPGMPVDEVLGRLSGMGRRFTGTGTYGEWSMQTATLTDETGSITVMFTKLDDQSFLEGAAVKLASRSYKTGVHGVKVSANKKTQAIELNVSSAAGIDRLEGGTASTPEETAAVAEIVNLPPAKSRDDVIMKQTCLKAAVERLSGGEKAAKTADIIKTAKDFYKALKEEEEEWLK